MRGLRPQVAGHEAQLRHELTRSLEATPVTDLGGQGHGRERIDPTEAAQTLDPGLVRRAEGQLLDLPVQLFSTAELVVEQREILAEHGAVFGLEPSVLQEAHKPTAVFACPVLALPVHEAPTSQELRHVMPRAQDLALEALPAAHEVSDPLIGRGRDPDRHELTGTVQPSQLRRVPTIDCRMWLWRVARSAHANPR